MGLKLFLTWLYWLVNVNMQFLFKKNCTRYAQQTLSSFSIFHHLYTAGHICNLYLCFWGFYYQHHNIFIKEHNHLWHWQYGDLVLYNKPVYSTLIVPEQLQQLCYTCYTVFSGLLVKLDRLISTSTKFPHLCQRNWVPRFVRTPNGLLIESSIVSL